MRLALAGTFDPRGETDRLCRFYEQMRALYAHIILSLPPHAPPADVERLRGLPGAQVCINEDWSHGRHRALREALATDATHIQYADMDRLIRWIETRADELRESIGAIEAADCLVFGRTEAAWSTHPQSLARTEAISNQVLSHLLGQPLDLSAGSRGFSRRAATFILDHTQPGRALGADAEWAVLLHRAGFEITVRWVDGLDWETADRYRDQAADAATQRQAADRYDATVDAWRERVRIAHEIIAAGLDALDRPLSRVHGSEAS